LETVFEPFNSTKSRGLGLGLPYSKKVIDEHGGQISVESQKNRGTRVEVMLPAEK
jgi:signal transduction histidine kinase